LLCIVGRTAAENRKLNQMLVDLAQMKSELLPDEKDKAREEEMKSFDDFQRKKHGLNVLLENIRKNVDRLNELRKKLSSDERDVQTIQLQSSNTDQLREALAQFNQLKSILQKDEKKTGKKKLDDKELADRRHYVILLGEEIKNLSNQNTRIKIVHTEEEEAIAARAERRKAKDSEKRERRERNRRNRGKSRGKDDDIVDEEELDRAAAGSVISEQELAFEEKVAANMAEQNEILVAISDGLDELKELATEANKQLTVQAAMLEQVDEKMDQTIKQFKTANQRLKNMLEESGGMSRWCPILICVIVLLALVGYIFGIVKV
jgi:hypothetical protein